MGPQASSLLLKLIIENTKKYKKVLSDEDYPEIVLLSLPVPNFTQDIKKKEAAKKLIIDRLSVLKVANTDINVIACNTAHLLLPDIQKASGLKFLRMPELVLQKVIDRNAKRVGLLASHTTVRSGLYSSEDLEIILPDNKDQKTINQLIMRQIQDDISHTDKEMLRCIVDKMIKKYDLDVVILGCTELPVILGDHPSVITSLHVLADEALKAV